MPDDTSHNVVKDFEKEQKLEKSQTTSAGTSVNEFHAAEPDRQQLSGSDGRRYPAASLRRYDHVPAAAV